MVALKYMLTFLMLMLISSASLSQQTEVDQHLSDVENNRVNYQWKVGLTPSALFNKYTTIQMNGAMSISKHFEVVLEAGWIFYSVTSNENSINGYRVRPSIRYYINPNQKIPFHFSVGYNIRKTKAIRIEEFFVAGQDKNDITSFEHHRLKKGLVLMPGMDIYLSRNFLVDVGFGVGFGSLSVDDREIPFASYRLPPYRDIYDFPGLYSQRAWLFNLKIQYAF